jgi:hypothetical protein
LSYSAILTSGTLFHWLTCGRPVLAPACGTIPAYVLDDWNGFAYRDQESLKRLLAHCEALPEEELARLGCNAQSTAAQLEWGMWNVAGLWRIRLTPGAADDLKAWAVAVHYLHG